MSPDPHTPAVPAAPDAVASEPVGHDGIRVDIVERPAWHKGSAAGITAFLLSVLAIPGGLALLIRGGVLLDNGLSSGGILLTLGIVLVIAAVLVFTMFTIVAPGQTSVRQFFGRYVGTVRRDGISFVAPFTTGRKVSVRVHNFETHELKVNDSDGNPVHIAAIVVWQVADTAKAVFAVESYTEFIETQAEAALRHVATTHPYDEPGPGEQSLRGSTDLVSAELAEEVAARVAIAGLEVLEVRISSLAYAPEIAQAMLQRQQASAVIAAREKIVEGAVTMVEQALGRLEDDGVVVLDDERRAQMVSNLLLVLTSDQRATPVINAGSLYS
ncbi:SPFH domain-containing protein [Leucobacter allii]|uniref:SPFH domain-containing protein n=1 Tax=Leucobacter allii TaxID=2932247 RepID=A0ABY4FR24_9MICO|nr:SPFH domain-containing protein [Leucobacter allii]UOQ58728.1 SPFH domain-containing protein [Leucobacter allii]